MNANTMLSTLGLLAAATPRGGTTGSAGELLRSLNVAANAARRQGGRPSSADGRLGLAGPHVLRRLAAAKA